MKLITVSLFIMLSMNMVWGETIKVITNVENPVGRITVDQLQDYFLKRARNWPDGTPVRFFDRSDSSSERRAFLDKYIKRSSRQVEQYWIGQKLYSGDSAPSQVSSDSIVVSLVSRFPGGIGYVSENFAGAKGVKIIEVVGE